MRVGIDVKLSTVYSNSSSVTATFRVYTQNQYWYSDNQTLSFGGTAGSGSTTFTNNSGSGAVLRAPRTATYNYASNGASPGSESFSATLSGAYNGVTPTKSVTVSLPARPINPPAPPTNFTATRSTDSQANLSWTRHPTQAAPITRQRIAMRSYQHSTPSEWAYRNINANSTSYNWGGLSANRYYEFAVRAENSAGTSVYVYSSYVYMTPDPPSDVVAALNATSDGIDIEWENNHYIASVVSVEIQRSTGGGSYSVIQTGLPQATTSWTDMSPGAGSNQYQVRSAVSGGLYSPWVSSNVVSTIVPPLAPTQLSPDGSARDMSVSQVFTWKHNHGGDGAGQSQYEVEYRIGSGPWIPLTSGTSSAASTAVPGGTIPNGAPVNWRVRTMGAPSGGWGPWSTAAIVNAYDPPTITLTGPPDPLNTLPVVVSWTYSQADGHPQTAYNAELIRESDGVLLQKLSASTAATSATFTAPIEDGEQYRINLYVRSSDVLWSAVGKWFTLDLLPPAEVLADTTYDECTGTMALDLFGSEPVPGTTEPVTHVDIQRSIDGGEWSTIAENILIPAFTTGSDPDLSLIDTTPSTARMNLYRVIAYAASGATAISPDVYAPGTDGERGSGLWAFLSYGDGFSQILRMRGDLQVATTSDRVRGSQPFLGRRLPLLLVGGQRSRTTSVSGVVRWDETCPEGDLTGCTYDSPIDDWEDASWEAGLVLYRDWTGRRIFGELSSVATEPGIPGMGSVAFSVTQTEFTERSWTI